jgi:hypothetical protein
MYAMELNDLINPHTMIFSTKNFCQKN